MKLNNYILFFIPLLFLTCKPEINCQVSGRNNLNDHSFAVGFVESSPDRFLSNPAKLRYIKDDIIGISIAPSMFGLQELNSGNIFYVYNKFDDFKIGANLYGMGGELYNEFSVSADIAYLLDDRLAFGGTAEISRLTVKDFNSYHNLLITLGSIVSVSDNIAAGISMNNILRQSYSNDSKTVYQRATIGLAVDSDDLFVFEIAGIINLNSSSGFLFGIKQELLDIMDVRLSVCTDPRSIEIGVNYLIGNYFSFNFNLFYDQELGFNRRLFIYGDI